MFRLRALLLRRPALALSVVLAALAMKLMLPAGYMLGGDGSRVLTLRVCEESSASQVTRQIAVPVSGEHGALPAQKQAKDSCPYAGHGAPVLGGADALLLALALAFVLALGLVPRPPLARQPAAYLRPPLRAPPAGV